MFQRSPAPTLLPGGFRPEAAPFLRSICADPDDDTARLVFADWLQENGDEPRAEFFRIQVELARLCPDLDDPEARRAAFDPSAYMQFVKQRTMLAANRNAWLAGYPRWAVKSLWPSFRRGLPTAVQASANDWAPGGAELRRWLPLEEVWLSRPSGSGFGAVLAARTLAGLKRLVVGPLDDSDLRVLAGSCAIDGLDTLRFTAYAVTSSALHELMRAPALDRLTALRADVDAGRLVVAAVANSPTLRNLRALRLGVGLDAEDAAELLGSPNLANVTDLDLSDNPLGDEAIRVLVRSPVLKCLTVIRLSRTQLTAASGRLLAGWPGLRSVRVLDLQGNELGLAGVQALAESPHLGALRVLAVLDNVPVAHQHTIRGRRELTGVQLS
ncbi:MAG: TIGR02996 domain-containing protein [Gemmataceae bacterium]|nr:TIGR02996 domain-containing protein [Gemmataceae bacterium]